MLLPEIMPPKAFTLKAGPPGRGVRCPDAGPVARGLAGRCGGDRAPHEHLGEDLDDDVPDLLGGRLDDFDRTAHELRT